MESRIQRGLQDYADTHQAQVAVHENPGNP
jgi:hypothetical protein